MGNNYRPRNIPPTNNNSSANKTPKANLSPAWMRCSQGCAPPSKTSNKTRPATPFLRMRGLPPAVPRHRRCRPRLCKGSTTLLKSGMGCRRKASHRRVMGRIDCFSLDRRWLISRTRFKCFRPPEIKLLGPVHTRHCLCRETSLVGM